MEWDFDRLERARRYKLLTGLVVPRPIALVTTLDADGVVNAAPFSFFNVLGDEPPIVIISVEDRDGGALKDTARNIGASGEFVVNLVDESIAARMHGCSVDYPPGVSEVARVGFTVAASARVRPPRLVEAPAALECTLHSRIDLDHRHLLIGQVRHLHVRDGLVDPATLRVDLERYHPVGRLFANLYARTGDRLALDPNEYLERMARAGRA
ncbi:MAG: flavin reductase family protein [Burkholderiales bacterium]|nr:flavin reductase family protein [Burkholderiales bacterium]